MQVLITILIISGRPFLLDDEFPTSSSPATKNEPVSKHHQPQLENIPGKSATEDQKSKPAKKSPAPLSTVASESTEMVMESAEEFPNTGKPYFCHYYHFFKSELF